MGVIMKSAPCGCRWQGRVDYTEDCSVIDRATWTGRQIVAHMTRNRKRYGV